MQLFIPKSTARRDRAVEAPKQACRQSVCVPEEQITVLHPTHERDFKKSIFFPVFASSEYKFTELLP